MIRNEAAVKTGTRNKNKSNNLRLGTRSLHLMLFPGLIILFIYAYLPMIGIVIAFQNFNVGLGIRAFWESEWVGLYHFRRLFSSPDFTRALRNTLFIASGKIVVGFFVPIVVALLLNEVRVSWYKRTIQTVVYLPHFLSWVIMAGVLKEILAPDGMLNNMLAQLFGLQPKFWLGDKQLFPWLMIITDTLKEFGFGTVIYLAAITGIDPSLYEAAVVDGANRFQQTIHVTIPGMMPIIVLSLVLSLGNVLNAGFDQIFNLYSVPVYETGDIIDTLVYRISMLGGQYDFGTAVGLFKSVVSMILISISYWLADRFAGYQVF
ncbi:ABC transporter permease [Mahella australiensis]|uniref:Binding-protein-dependent transport systems inner membrane component n=1 Tax=Mahella australiensis (strain DSM 15567 / CIP 107919 / 50-1 BON) TaxID=697281 RepID=F4A0U2_MAHA5|nr:ABC transporter permease subunit [Mahella australiensis]AEE96988.1 binding-protein-dependent transport systems inner membrane component [Mahella australiensis 50-1 BON]